MEQKSNREVIVFFTALAVIAITFVGGIGYLKKGSDALATVDGAANQTADIAANVLPTVAAATSTATTTIITTTSTGKTIVATSSLATSGAPTAAAGATTGASAPTPKPTPASAPVATSTPSKPAPTSTPAKPAPAPVPVKPAPTPTPAPAPAPKPAPAPVALSLPYAETNFTGDKNWTATWGKMAIDDSGLIEMTTGKGGTGGAIHLLHAASWTDYTFTANVNWVSGETFDLIANYQNDKNEVRCQFDEQDTGDVVISLQQFRNGQELTLYESGVINILNDGVPSSNYTASIRVQGVDGSCSFDNHNISNSLGGGDTYLINQPYTGGIGVEMWDSSPNTAALILNSVSVVPNY